MSLKCPIDRKDSHPPDPTLRADRRAGPRAAGTLFLPLGCYVSHVCHEGKGSRGIGLSQTLFPLIICLLSLQLAVTLWLRSGQWNIRASLLRPSWERLFLQKAEMRRERPGSLSPSILPWTKAWCLKLQQPSCYQGVTEHVCWSRLRSEPKERYFKPIPLHRQSPNFSSSETLSLNRERKEGKRERRKREGHLSFLASSPLKWGIYVFLLMSRKKT